MLTLHRADSGVKIDGPEIKVLVGPIRKFIFVGNACTGLHKLR